MALSYPVYFPIEFLDPVVAAASVAERQFRTAIVDASGDRERSRKAAVEYVVALVLAFARQTCEAVVAGNLSASEINEFVEDFERRSAVHAFYDLGLKGLWSTSEFLRETVAVAVRTSSGWLEHLRNCEEAAKARQGARTGIPPEVQRVLDWYFLLLQAEFDRIESKYRVELANVGSPEVVSLVESFVLERFDAGASWLEAILPVQATTVSLFGILLEQAIAKSREYIKAVFHYWPISAQEDVDFRISQKLRAKALALTSQARFRLFDQQQAEVRNVVQDITGKFANRQDSEHLMRHRRRVVKQYQQRHDLTTEALARRVGISVTAIRGIINDDRKRFSESTRNRFLQAIGVSQELWNGPNRS